MNGYNVKNSNKVFLLAMFLPQVLSIIVVLIFSMFYEDAKAMQNSMAYIICAMLVAQVAFAIIYGIFVKKNKINVLTHVKNKAKQVNFVNIFLCVLISAIAVVGLVYFVNVFDKLFGLIGYKDSGIGLPNNTFGYFALNVLIGAVLPAIFEELIFRGIIFKGFLAKGFWFASIVSSVMFMLVHFSLGSVVYPLIMGMVFCFVVKKTGSTLYSIIVHFCNNFIVLLVQYIENVTGNAIFGNLTSWWHYVLAFAMAGVALFAIYLIISRCMIQKNKEPADDAVNETGTANETNESIVQKENQSLIVAEQLNDYKALMIGFAFWLVIIVTSFI